LKYGVSLNFTRFYFTQKESLNVFGSILKENSRPNNIKVPQFDDVKEIN